MFTKNFYIQIRENQIDIRNVKTAESFQEQSEFSHPRMLIGNFTKVVVHPLDKVEGGLSQIEERVLRELAIGSGGASKVVVWTGAKLSDSEVIAKLEAK